MKTIAIGKVEIPTRNYAIGGTALLGIRGSGKTVTAKGIAEQLMDQGVPIIVFDAIGVWRHLKVPAKRGGEGFPVVVAGGKGADLPLTVAAAPEIVRAAIRENVNLVIDLYDRSLSKSDWRRIVQACFRVLMYENEGVRHIFLEEAAEYIPQKVTDGETYAEVEKVARMGGNSSLGLTIINQRAQEVNKAVLDLCENLVLMRQRGAHAIDALERWIDKVSPDFAKRITADMPKMGTGDAWIFAGDADEPVRVKVPLSRTYHPDRKNPDVQPAGVAADTGRFVAALRGALPKIAAEAEANDPKKLRSRIAELERQAKQAQPVPIDPAAIDRARHEGFEEGKREALRLHRELRDRVAAAIGQEPAMQAAPSPARRPVAAPVSVRAAPVRQYVAPKANGNGAGLSTAARKILAVLSQFPEGCEAGKLTLLTGYRYSGSFQNALSELRTAGCIDGANTGTMRITDEGLAHGPFPELPQGDDLVRYWLNHPSFSKAARSILDKLQDGSEQTAEDLCKATGYSYSGSFQNALSELRTAGVLLGRNTEAMRISREIVP